MSARALAPTRVLVLVVLASLLAASLLVTVASQVRAATITVNTNVDELNDDGDCSLREAIEAANTNTQVDECAAGQADPTDDVISVPAGTYTLSISGAGEDDNQTGDLDLGEHPDGEVDDHVTINGAGAATTFIDGNSAANDDVYAPDRVFDVQGGTATLTGMTIRNGTSSNGGGVRADDGSVTITDATITGNVAEGDRRGGGLYVHSSVSATLTRVTVSGNTAYRGGGIYNNSDGDDGEDGGTPGLLVQDSVISGNTAEERPLVKSGEAGGMGGGIFNDDDAEIVRTSITGNTAESNGGGIFNDGFDDNEPLVPTGALLAVTSSTISGNDAEDEGGGIFNQGGGMNIADSTISGNDAEGEDGGGIGSVTVELNLGQDDVVTIAGYEARLVGEFATDIIPFMEITGSTISGNTAADDAGGLENDGDAVIVNSTISGNRATDEAGGVYNDGDLEMYFTTVASNTAQGGAGSGGGLFLDEASSVDLYATMIVNNADEDCFSDGFIGSWGSNMASDGTCDLDQSTDQATVTDPKIGPLADNGGPTLTHALLFDSAAVDEVEPAQPPLVSGVEFLLVGGFPTPDCPADVPTDQRGATVGPRPVDGDGDGEEVCDIGAFELQAPAASINDVMVTEGNSGTVPATFTVTLSRASTGTVTYAWSSANGTATAPGDYQTASGTVSFAPGDTSETLTVNVVGDTVDEPNETFTVNLATPTGGGVIADGAGTGTILDDEGPIVTPTQAQLPNTGTDDGVIGATGAAGAGLAVLIALVAAGAWIRERRRVAIRR